MSVKTRPSHTESPGTMEGERLAQETQEELLGRKVRAAEGSGSQDFQNVDTVALGDQRELR